VFSLRVSCPAEEVDVVSADLWEQGTAGIREQESGTQTVLIAAFETDLAREQLLEQFANYEPEWLAEEATDWAEYVKSSWPAREVGDRLFVAPVWSTAKTPADRVRVVHNPGLASGTGEHPCTLLALEALERLSPKAARVVDVGTGSGMLAIAALRLGARQALALDTDFEALQVARENFQLNGLKPQLVAGSCNALGSGCSTLTVANISGTVLLSMFDDLLRITSPNGHLILTGFPEWELAVFRELLPGATVSGMNEWRCVVSGAG
jgi:ribosomal protein L11 methyltransferase